MNKFLKHYEESVTISTTAKNLFDFVDDHNNFSSHMNKPSLMMGGGKMTTKMDQGNGKSVGSHIYLKGKAFGIEIYLDEIVTKHDQPRYKEWETVGEPKLLIIGKYRMGLEIKETQGQSSLRVFIDYDLPSGMTRIIGILLGDSYARWCVRQMVNGAIANWR